MDRIEEIRVEMLKAGYSAQDADRVCQLEAECGRECDAIRAKYDAQISEITGKYVSAEEQYEVKLAGIEARIGAMRQELKENSTYTEEDIEEICDIESSYERHCAMWEKAYLEAGLAPEGPGFELRILDEEVWREKELKEIDEKYWFSEFREEGGAPAIDDSKYDYAQQRMIQEGYYPMELIEDHGLRKAAAEQWYAEQMAMLGRVEKIHGADLMVNGIYSMEDAKKVNEADFAGRRERALVSKQCIEDGYPPFGHEYSERSKGADERSIEQIIAINEKYGFGGMEGPVTLEDIRLRGMEPDWEHTEGEEEYGYGEDEEEDR